MTLREKQSLFVKLVGMLITEATALGYELTFGEAHRSKEEAERLAQADKGIRNSLHTVRLAVDLNLFKDGKYLSKSEDHRPLGLWWEKLSTNEYTCTWGGRFGDGNHYSIAHAGKK